MNVYSPTRQTDTIGSAKKLTRDADVLKKSPKLS